MTNKTLKIGAIVLGVALLTVGALGVGRTALADGDGDSEPGMVARLHAHLSAKAAHAGHGGPFGHDGPHAAMAQLLGQLDLTELQEQDLRQVHEALMSGFMAHGEVPAPARESFMAGVADANLTAYEIEVMANAHLDGLRQAISDAADPMASLINSLDDEQRATLMAHLHALHGEG